MTESSSQRRKQLPYTLNNHCLANKGSALSATVPTWQQQACLLCLQSHLQQCLHVPHIILIDVRIPVDSTFELCHSSVIASFSSLQLMIAVCQLTSEQRIVCCVGLDLLL